jgi:hypothetical protein
MIRKSKCPQPVTQVGEKYVREDFRAEISPKVTTLKFYSELTESYYNKH